MGQNKKQKILVIPGWYPGALEPLNGDFVRDQVRLLRKEGMHIDVIYSDLNIAYLKKGLFRSMYKVSTDGFGNKDYIRTGPYWPKNTLIGLKRWVTSFSKWVECYLMKEGMPDIVHAHTYLGAMVAQRVKKKYQVPYIVTEHYTGWLDGSIRDSHKTLGVNAFQASDKVVSVGKSLGLQLEINTDNKIDVFHNFIDVDLFSPSVRSVPNADFQIICIGDLIKRKNVSHIISTVSNLINNAKQVHLKIVGIGPELKKLKGLCKSLQIEKHVSFLGQLRKEDVAEELKQADLLIHASKLETFGLVILEALCTGVPVLSSYNKGVEEMKHLPGVFLFDVNDRLNCFNGVMDIIARYGSIDRHQIRMRASQSFGPKQAASNLRSLYDQFLFKTLYGKKRL